MLCNVTQCAGANTRPHQLRWSDWGMGTALLYNKNTQEAHHIHTVGRSISNIACSCITWIMWCSVTSWKWTVHFCCHWVFQVLRVTGYTPFQSQVISWYEIMIPFSSKDKYQTTFNTLYLKQCLILNACARYWTFQCLTVSFYCHMYATLIIIHLSL